jgi:hypothetical protein
MSRVILPQKNPSSTIFVQFDFTSQILSGDTISGVNGIVATVYSGVDPTPNNILGTDSVSGAVVTLHVTGGVTGVTYTVSCTVTTTNGYSLIQVGNISVLPEVL